MPRLFPAENSAPAQWLTRRVSSLRRVITACLLGLGIGCIIGLSPAQAQNQPLFRSSVTSEAVESIYSVPFEAFAGQWLNGVGTTPVDPRSLEILQSFGFRGWLRARNHRAFAVGTPASCPFSWRSSGYPNREMAVEAAMAPCVRGALEFNAHQPEQCGCRIALVDDQLYVDPADLAVPKIIPALWDFGEGNLIVGVIEYDRLFGEDNAVEFRDNLGDLRCQGTFSTSIALIDNRFQLNCDFAEGVLRGSLRVRNLQSFNPHGETVVRDADNRRIHFVVAQAVVHYLEGR